MTEKISRFSKVREKSKCKTHKRGGKKAPPPSMLDSLPVEAETVRKVSMVILGGMVAAVGLALAAAFQVPQMIGTSAGEAVGKAGFAVKRVEIKGLKRMERLPVYDVAFDQSSTAMPLVDLDGTRQRLLRFGWVQEARVSRRWPDTLVVDVVERTPAAIWQHNQQLALIDREGVVLEPVKLEAMPDLPLVIGPAANHHASELTRLLAAAPELKPMLAGATWIGGRRWDLRFQSGEVLALPEGEATSQRALVKFANLDKSTRLLGQGLVRFDMRIPGKFIVRVSSEPGSKVPEAPAEAAGTPGSENIDPATTI